MLVSKEFNVKPPCLAYGANKEDSAEHEKSSESSEQLLLVPEQQNPTHNTIDSLQADLEAVGDLFDSLLAGNKAVHDACRSEVLAKVVKRLEKAKMWLQFMKMMKIIRKFLKGERMGIWEMHIQAIHDMLPYLAASGHNLYTKSIQFYLQQMSKLQEASPEVYRHFSQGAARCPKIKSFLGWTISRSCN